MNYTKEELTYWYNYIFDCFSKGFDEFEIEHHRIENHFSLPMTYKHLRKKELAIRFVHDLTEYYKIEELNRQNNPLKFEELCEDEQIWDKKYDMWRFVLHINFDTTRFYDCTCNKMIYFEENRLYRKKVY